VAILLAMGLSGGLACSDAGPSAFADVSITVTTTGAAPAITNLAISVDGQEPLLPAIGDTLPLSLAPGSHAFHWVLLPHNCPSSRPDPEVIQVNKTPSPSPVSFALNCF
jgi:hypothetical protein